MKKIVTNITYTIFILLVLGLVFLLMAPPLPGLGNFEVKIVKSGSMEPTIMTGAVVAIHESSSYKVGDVITFAERGVKIPTTHRIIGMEKVDGANHFITKGDANEERDANLVLPSDIIGKVVFDIPFVGFVLDFARQPLGFGLLVGIPALMIVLDELTNIWLEVRRIRGIRFGKEMIAPLVVAPYDPNQVADEGEPANNFYKNYLPVTVPVAKRMDIKPIQRKDKKIISSQSVNSDYGFSHDIRPKMSTAIASFAIVVLLWGQVFGEFATLAYPSDTEASLNNNLRATAVDFSVSSDKTVFSVRDNQITDDASALINLTLHDLVSKDLVYDVEVQENGASALCGLLILEAEAPFSYNGDLLNLSKTNLSLGENFSLNFSLSDSYDGFDSCIFDLVFTAHLADGGVDSAYFDVETITFEFSPNSFVELNDNSLSSSESNVVFSEEVQIEKKPGVVSEEVIEEAKEIENNVEKDKGNTTTKEDIEVDGEEQKLESEEIEQNNGEIEQVANEVPESKEIGIEEKVEEGVVDKDEQQKVEDREES